MPHWTVADLPDLSGMTFLVTGANSGLGAETVKGLSSAGAAVLLGVRNAERGQAVIDATVARRPKAELRLVLVDLTSLASVRAAAEEVSALGPLHGLVNNAGVMATPKRLTDDGFELQLGTNHLAHFALTGLLLPSLLAAGGARVVTVSSGAHKAGRIDFDDLQSERSYQRWTAYSQSKLANLLFAFELGRRAEAAGLDLVSAAAHPGYAATQLQAVGPRMAGSQLQERMMSLLNVVIAQEASQGALPQLYAAGMPDVRNGDYFGPDGIIELRGWPRKVAATSVARDPELARRLWKVSEELTGVTFAALAS